MIRFATAADISALVDLGAQMHAESRFARYAYDRAKVGKMLAAMLQPHPYAFVAVAERDEQPIGVLVGELGTMYFADVPYAYDKAVFIRADRRGGFAAAGLIDAFVQWARERGAREVQLGCSAAINSEHAGRLYQRLSFEPAGGMFYLNL